MMLSIQVDENGRVLNAAGGGGHIEGGITVPMPKEWDWEHANDWVLVDGALVYSPMEGD